MSKKIFTISDFSGGVDKDSHNTQVDDNEVVDLEVASVEHKGKISFGVLKPADSSITTSSLAWDGLHENNTETDPIEYLEIIQDEVGDNIVYRERGLYKWGNDILYSDLGYDVRNWSNYSDNTLGGNAGVDLHTAGGNYGYNLNVLPIVEDQVIIWRGKGASTHTGGTDCVLGLVDTSSGANTNNPYYNSGGDTENYMRFRNAYDRYMMFYGGYHSNYIVGGDSGDDEWGDPQTGVRFGEIFTGWYSGTSGRGLDGSAVHNQAAAFFTVDSDDTYIDSHGTTVSGTTYNTVIQDVTAAPINDELVAASYFDDMRLNAAGDQSAASVYSGMDTDTEYDISQAHGILCQTTRGLSQTLQQPFHTIMFRVGADSENNHAAGSSDNKCLFGLNNGLDVKDKDFYIEIAAKGTYDGGTAANDLSSVLIMMSSWGGDTTMYYVPNDYRAYFQIPKSEFSAINAGFNAGEKVRMRIPWAGITDIGSQFDAHNVAIMGVLFYCKAGGKDSSLFHYILYELSLGTAAGSTWSAGEEDKKYKLSQSHIYKTPIASNAVETLPIEYTGILTSNLLASMFQFTVFKATILSASGEDGVKDGGYIYWQECDDTGVGKGDKFLLCEMNQTNGVKPANADSFTAWSNDKVSFTLTERPTNMTQTVNSGYPFGTEEIVANWKHSAVVGRIAYIGNVHQSGAWQSDKILKSAVGKPMGFSDATYIDIESGPITAMISAGDRLFVFTNEKLLIINVAQDFEYIEATMKGYGIGRPRQVCHVLEGIAFVTRHNVIYFDGNQFHNIGWKGMKSMNISYDGTTSYNTLKSKNYPSNGRILFEPKRQHICVWDFDISAYRHYSIEKQKWVASGRPFTANPQVTRATLNANHAYYGAGISSPSLHYLVYDHPNSTDGVIYTKFYNMGSNQLKLLHDVRIRGKKWTADNMFRLTIYRNGKYEDEDIMWLDESGAAAVDMNFPAADNDEEWRLSSVVTPAADQYQANQYNQSLFRSIGFKIESLNVTDDDTEIHEIDIIYRDISLDNEKEGTYS